MSTSNHPPTPSGERDVVEAMVEQLRDTGCDREPFTPEHAKCKCRFASKVANLLEAQQAELERLRSQPPAPTIDALDRIIKRPLRYDPTGYNDGPAVIDANGQMIAALFWPGHEPENTDRAEGELHLIASRFVDAANAIDTDDDQVYEIGKRDGYMDAVQEIDGRTGGDGEFYGSTIPGRGMDVPTMLDGIVDRFEELKARAQPSLSGEELVEALASVVDGAMTYDDYSPDSIAKALISSPALTSHIKAQVEAGRAEEREACARIAEADKADTQRQFNDDAVVACKSATADDIADAIRSRGPSPTYLDWRSVKDDPPPINERILVFWPQRGIDDDGMPVGKIIGGSRVMAEWDGNHWDEPEWMASAPGAHYFGDDWEHAEAPILWAPILADPVGYDTSPLPATPSVKREG